MFLISSPSQRGARWTRDVAKHKPATHNHLPNRAGINGLMWPKEYSWVAGLFTQAKLVASGLDWAHFSPWSGQVEVGSFCGKRVYTKWPHFLLCLLLLDDHFTHFNNTYQKKIIQVTTNVSQKKGHVKITNHPFILIIWMQTKLNSEWNLDSFT